MRKRSDEEKKIHINVLFHSQTHTKHSCPLKVTVLGHMVDVGTDHCTVFCLFLNVSALRVSKASKIS